jgi:hypothetical protein
LWLLIKLSLQAKDEKQVLRFARDDKVIERDVKAVESDDLEVVGCSE